MPKIFEYLGIVIYFYSNEHEPIHIHAKKDNRESRASILMKDGVITEIIIQDEKGRLPLEGKELKDLKEFLDVYAYRIVQKWIEYFVYGINLNSETIQRKLK